MEFGLEILLPWEAAAVGLWLALIFVAERQDTDSNHGTLFGFRDPLSGTRGAASRRADMPVGVAGRAELPLLRLFARPFLGRDGIAQRETSQKESE